MRVALLAALLLASAAAAAEGQRMVPAACGVRATLWIEHYTAELFVPPGRPPAAALADPSQPKALRMQITNAKLMPRDVPRRWREALQPALGEETMKRLRDGYHRLESGDTVEVSYAPGRGVTLRLNEQQVLSAAGHAVIEAIIGAWANDAPFEKKLAGTLARNPCA